MVVQAHNPSPVLLAGGCPLAHHSAHFHRVEAIQARLAALISELLPYDHDARGGRELAAACRKAPAQMVHRYDRICRAIAGYRTFAVLGRA